MYLIKEQTCSNEEINVNKEFYQDIKWNDADNIG